MKQLFTHGVEAVPRHPASDDNDWLIRPRHPDGHGYAPITLHIPKKLAELWVRAIEDNADTYVEQALTGFESDPADTDFQRGYQQALCDVRDRK